MTMDQSEAIGARHADLVEPTPAGLSAAVRATAPVVDRSSKPAKKRLVRRDGNEGHFSRLLSAAADWPAVYKAYYVELGRLYYAAVEADSYIDDSFAIVRGKEPALVVACNVKGGVLGRFGGPIEFQFDPQATLSEAADDLGQAFGELKRLAKLRGAQSISFRSAHETDPHGVVASWAIGEGAVPRIKFRAEIDLSLSDDELGKDRRATHRQRIKWGLEHLSIEVLTAATVTPAIFDEYRAFHARIAGRVTRPIGSWDAMLDWVRSGAGELVVGRLDGALVAASLCFDALDTTYYASAVYDRAQFEHPIGHAIVWTMICRAKARGMRFFDVGAVFAADEPVSEKERAIGHFKHGFTSRMVHSTYWTLKV